ncbi:MAG: hypothetical protein HQ513_13090 [Rhodospirillales bacterium]|nr:hypothetical protein [Rhodospirillales bacterium]
MGGLFSAPSPPAQMSLPEAPDPEIEARKKRLEEIERRRRGRSGTITTSPRGLLGLSDNAPKRKSLLGE